MTPTLSTPPPRKSNNGPTIPADIRETLKYQDPAYYEARRFNHKKQPPKLRPIYTLAGQAICTPGNLATVNAAVKSGKSSVIGAMISAAMIDTGDQSRDALGFWAENPNGLALLHFDSEQSPDDHWWLVHRALKRAGLTEPPTWLFSYCLTGLNAAESWRFVKNIVAHVAEECGGVHSILIDGAADLVANVNDPAECNAFVAELHNLAIEQDCPIIGVIHFNPGSDKTRGHLGSQLERKSETNLRLDKDDDGIIELWSEKQRRAPIVKGSGPCFAWNDKADMHVTVENPADARHAAKADAKREEMRTEAESVFAQGKKPFHHKALVERMAERLDQSEVCAKKKLRRWVENGIAVKDEASGLYTLSL